MKAYLKYFLPKTSRFLAFFICCIFISFLPCSYISNTLTARVVTKAKLFEIGGKVTQTNDYCGGAKPTKALLENLAKPRAYANKIFYIKEGKINTANGRVLDSFTTKEDGSFSFHLPNGTYSIVVAEQLHPINVNDYQTKNQKVDESCLSAWWQKPYYLLKVKGHNITSLNFSFHRRCFINNDLPCIIYTGPQPH